MAAWLLGFGVPLVGLGLVLALVWRPARRLPLEPNERLDRLRVLLDGRSGNGHDGHDGHA